MDLNVWNPRMELNLWNYRVELNFRNWRLELNLRKHRLDLDLWNFCLELDLWGICCPRDIDDMLKRQEEKKLFSQCYFLFCFAIELFWKLKYTSHVNRIDYTSFYFIV